MRSLSTVAIVCLGLLVLAGGVQAQEKPLYFYGGLGYGKALNDNAPGGSIGLQGGMIYRLEGQPFAVGGEAGYLMLGKKTLPFDEDWTLSAIQLTGQGYYLIPSNGTVLPYLTGGLGFYVTKSKFDANNSIYRVSSDTSNTDIGINLGGGLKLGDPAKSFQYGGDARFHIVMTDNESTKIFTLMARIYI